MKTEIKVLCVGNTQFCDSLLSALPNSRARVVRATTLAAARQAFVSNPDIDIIITNDSVERELDALEFVDEVRGESAVLMWVYCPRRDIARQFATTRCHSVLSSWGECKEALADIAACRC